MHSHSKPRHSRSWAPVAVAGTTTGVGHGGIGEPGCPELSAVGVCLHNAYRLRDRPPHVAGQTKQYPSRTSHSRASSRLLGPCFKTGGEEPFELSRSAWHPGQSRWAGPGKYWTVRHGRCIRGRTRIGFRPAPAAAELPSPSRPQLFAQTRERKHSVFSPRGMPCTTLAQVSCVSVRFGSPAVGCSLTRGCAIPGETPGSVAVGPVQGQRQSPAHRSSTFHRTKGRHPGRARISASPVASQRACARPTASEWVRGARRSLRGSPSHWHLLDEPLPSRGAAPTQ